MLETAGLQCMRGDRILFSGLDFKLATGECLHIKGPNGAGKTSLLRMLCGLVAPSEGEVRWDGQNIRKLSEEFNQHLLYIGHGAGIKADLSALENLIMANKINGLALSEDDAWDALQKIGLRGREDLPTKVLSQGQKRRVALARMLVNPSKLWILDEPFVALDVEAVAMLEGVLDEHLARGGMIALTTHQDFKLPTGKLRTLLLEAS